MDYGIWIECLTPNSSVSFAIIGFHPLDVLEEINYGFKVFFPIGRKRRVLIITFSSQKASWKVGKRRWGSVGLWEVTISLFFCEMYLEKVIVKAIMSTP